MALLRLRSLALVALAALVSCSSPPSPQAQVAENERTALAPLKARYSDVIMGYDFHETSVDVSVDLNAMLSMDEDKEDAMKADALRSWAQAWKSTHPGQHATLTVRIIDFRGNQESKANIRV